MQKPNTTIQKLSLFFAVVFLIVVAISHWPGLTDAQGKLMGLFKIDPVDDIFHLLSGIAGVIAALTSVKWSRIYLIAMAFLYGMDVITGLFFSREFLNLTVFTEGLGLPNFSISNLLINGPHLGITILCIWGAIVLNRGSQQQRLN
jgi:hypothetical protein